MRSIASRRMRIEEVPTAAEIRAVSSRSMDPGSRCTFVQLVRDMRCTDTRHPPRPFGALVPVCRTPETSGSGLTTSPQGGSAERTALPLPAVRTGKARRNPRSNGTPSLRARWIFGKEWSAAKTHLSVFLGVRPSTPDVLAHAVRGEAKQAPCRSAFRRHSIPASGAGCKPVPAGHRIPIHVQVCLENTPSRPGWDRITPR